MANDIRASLAGLGSRLTEGRFFGECERLRLEGLRERCRDEETDRWRDDDFPPITTVTGSAASGQRSVQGASAGCRNPNTLEKTVW